MKFRKSKKSDGFVVASPIDHQLLWSSIGMVFHSPSYSSTPFSSASSAYSFNYSDGLSSYTSQSYYSPNVSINLSYRSYRPSLASTISSYYHPAQYAYNNLDTLNHLNRSYANNATPANLVLAPVINRPELTLVTPLEENDTESENLDEIKPGQVCEATFETDETDKLDFGESHSDTSEESFLERKSIKNGNIV